MTNKSFTVESKSQLAKLLAAENITVQHQKLATAMFDPKNRVLYCPIWSDMSGALYDLLLGHEVGHAIDTPADGWHDAVSDKGKNYKGFLNVVEDARIEKRQKRRYPGLRPQFIKGYQELMVKDFFGIKDTDINTLPFIDRLNLLTKSDYTQAIDFSPEESILVEKVKACETWDDVLRVTGEVWDYSKEEQKEQQIDQYDFDDEYDYDDDGDDSDDEFGENDDGTDETDGQGERKGKPQSLKDGDDGDEEEQDSSESKQAADAVESDEDGERDQGVNRQKESSSSFEDQFEPNCRTDDAFRQNEVRLLDKKSRAYVYTNLPVPNLDRIVTPVNRVQEILTEEFKAQNLQYDTVAKTLFENFRKKNERFIGLLAKEFEMRKAATRFSKAKIASTGDIDVNKIYKYQIDDTIFKKMMRVPKGKSHGMILLLDKSGSMSNNMGPSLEQILILAMFCRKVNIPFAAYGFGNAIGVREIDFPEIERHESFSNGCFSENSKDLRFSDVYLREFINSKMGAAEFSKAVKNILCLIDAYSTRYHGGRHFHRPMSEALSNTPLTEALVALQPMVKEFRKINNLDIVNTVIVHDGDADEVTSYVDANPRTYFSTKYHNVFVTDTKTKFQLELKEDVNGDEMRIAISKWFAKTTGSKLIGFFLVEHGSHKSALRRRLFNDELNAVRNSGDIHVQFQMGEVLGKYTKILRKEKYLESKNDGYDSFYILPAGSDLSIDDDEFEMPTKVNTNNLAKAFTKVNKSRQINRVLVSRFIGNIAV